MNKTAKMATVASLAAAVAALAVPAVWMQPDAADMVPVPDNGTDGDAHEGGTFRLPPAPYTEAHDEWIEWYRAAELNAIESQTRDAALMAHDFEVAFHPDPDRDGSFIAVALLAKRDRLDGMYAPNRQRKAHARLGSSRNTRRPTPSARLTRSCWIWWDPRTTCTTPRISTT